MNDELLDSRYRMYVDWTDEELKKLLIHIDGEVGKLRAELDPWREKLRILDEVVQEGCNVQNLLFYRKNKES